MKWEHINIIKRKAIVSALVHHYSLKEIAELTDLDPTSISKEIIRNRAKTKIGKRKSTPILTTKLIEQVVPLSAIWNIVDIFPVNILFRWTS